MRSIYRQSNKNINCNYKTQLQKYTKTQKYREMKDIFLH